MKILVLGSDGYIGYPLVQHLLKKGHEVSGFDNHSRRMRVTEIRSHSLTPIADPIERESALLFNYPLYRGESVGLTEPITYNGISMTLKDFMPDTIVHLAEMPSAPWSMRSPYHSAITQGENILGTLNLLWAIKSICPSAHLVKLGTMGEYGTPECDIPEGKIPLNCISGFTDEYKEHLPCDMAGLPFPRTAGSFYHLSKVHDTHNIIFACRTWGLRSTDIMQGVVFGLNECKKEEELTRFDYDEYFGTVINRFCVQALIGHPLTIYGEGNQIRGYLPLKDSIQCITLAIENPPKPGEYRTLNQFASTYTVNRLAVLVVESALDLGLPVDGGPIPNPRVENENNYYNPAHQTLFDLGYEPTLDIRGEITNLIARLIPYNDKVRREVILPKTTWK